MEKLSFDMDHIQRSEILRRHKPSHVSEGLRNGLSGLGLSILGMFLILHRIFLRAHFLSFLCYLLLLYCCVLRVKPTRDVILSLALRAKFAWFLCFHQHTLTAAAIMFLGRLCFRPCIPSVCAHNIVGNFTSFLQFCCTWWNMNW